MGRRATGQAVYKRDKQGVERWHARTTELDGTRPYHPINERWATENTPESKALAKQACEGLSAFIRGNAAVPKGTGETAREWFKRFHAYKEARGLRSIAGVHGRAENWIFPVIGHRPMAEITREDLERVVSKIDAAIILWQKHGAKRGKGISPSTAANIWGDVTHAFDEACNAKDRALRALTVNPCEGVRGPETDAARDGPILYGDEIVKLLVGKSIVAGRPDVPLYRRRVYAFAIYTMARRSEIAALKAADVDLKHQTIMISKQIDRQSGKKRKTTKTKTGRTRTIDIEPHLLPLVELLVRSPDGRDGALVRVPPAEDCAELLRKDLHTVGVERDALHTQDTTRTQGWFHHLRDSGLTHMAVRGDSPIVIQWRGGHQDFKTTQGYIARGQTEARRIGVPLPRLPECLLHSKRPESDIGPVRVRNSQPFRALGVTPTGIEPVLPT